MNDSGAVKAALANLQDIDQQFLPELLVILRGTKDGFEFKAARPTSELATKLLEVVTARAAQFADRELVAYAPATEVAEGQVMFVPASQVAVIAADSGDSADLPLFEPNARSASRVRFYAITSQSTDGTPIVIYRHLQQNNLLSRSKKFVIFSDGSKMDLVKQPTLVIDTQVDALQVGEWVFFANRGGFERAFGFLEAVRADAGETFDTVTAALKIDGLEDMRAAALGSPAMLGKMASIAEKLDKYPQYKESLTMPKLKAFVEAHPQTGVKIEGDGDDAQFVFGANPQERFKILKLMDDDYLRSQLTELDYEANSKGMPL